MLTIRLQRVGRRNDPSFRVVVMEKRKSPTSGTALETLGWYNPHTDTKQIDGERVKHWLSHGAQASGTIHNLLVDEKIIEGSKVNVLSKKTPIVSEKEEEEAPAAEPQGEAADDTTAEASEETAEPESDTAEAGEAAEQEVEEPQESTEAQSDESASSEETQEKETTA